VQKFADDCSLVEQGSALIHSYRLFHSDKQLEFTIWPVTGLASI
jgi:hypothetical protein